MENGLEFFMTLR